MADHKFNREILLLKGRRSGCHKGHSTKIVAIKLRDDSQRNE